MKIYSKKKNDNFFLPVINNSCRDDLSYRVQISDLYSILSIKNNETIYNPGESRYITVPKIPGFAINDGSLVAVRGESPVYFLEVQISSFAQYQHFEEGKKFYLFSEEGLFTGIELEYVTTVGSYPRFAIDQYSLMRLLGGNLPDVNSPITANGSFTLTLQPESRTYLQVQTSTDDYVEKYASVKVEVPGKRVQYYEFYITPQEEKIDVSVNPPLEESYDDTAQLARSFVPISTSMTLQLNSDGELFMDKIWASASAAQASYRRRCTNLGFGKDCSKFFEYVPKDSIYAFNEIDLKYSTDKFSEQYFTGINAGVERTIGRQESLKAFAPLWLKGRVPQYFVIFAKPVTSTSGDLFTDSRVVKTINIQDTELGPYLNDLTSHDNFYKSPVSIDGKSNYSVTWNGISVENGEWSEHIEFLGSDIQSGLSDFEFNDIVTSGFSRGNILSPQFLNIEYLFDDKDASPFEIYQYFGLYCDSIEIGKYGVDLQKTNSLFTQDFSSSPDKFLTDSLVISSKDDVKLILKAERKNEAKMISRSSDEATKSSNIYALRHYATTDSANEYSKKLIISIHSMFDPEDLRTGSFIIRLEKEDGTFVKYINVVSAAYSSTTGIATLTCADDDVYSGDGQKYFVRFFDFNPNETVSANGSIRLDSPVSGFSNCLVISKNDVSGNSISTWLNQVFEQSIDVRQAIVLYDTASLGNITFIPESMLTNDYYHLIFFDLLESNGSFSNGGNITVDLLSEGKSVSFPPSTMVSSPGRQFILQTRNSHYSVKNVDIIDAGNEINSVTTVNSNIVDFGNMKSDLSSSAIVAEKLEDFRPFCEINMLTNPGYTAAAGDSIFFERKTKTSIKRWQVMLDDRASVDLTTIGGWKKKIEFNEFDTNSKRTVLEIMASDVFPESHLIYTLVAEDPNKDVKLDFISAESVGDSYRLYFAGGPFNDEYTHIQIENIARDVVYTPIDNALSLEEMFLVGLQAFNNSPFKCFINEGNLCLVLEDNTGECSLILSSYSNRGIKINGRIQKKSSIVYNNKTISSSVLRFHFKNSEHAYSIPIAFSESIKNETTVFSVLGKNCKILPWQDDLLCIPDVLSSRQGKNGRVVISLDSPALIKDGRMKLVDNLEVSINLMSFKRFVDLNFFDELPYRESQGVSFSRVGLFANSSTLGFTGEEYTKQIIVRNRSSITKDQSTNNMLASMRSQKGKTFPSVGRWKKANSSNVNLAPYTLNVDPLQLQYDNFTGVPYNDVVPDTFPLDFYVISGWPMSASEADEMTYDYTGKRIDAELLKSIDYDYFSAYFTVGEGSEKFTSGNKRNYKTLWSKISKSSDGSYRTMFKGLPLTLKSKVDLSDFRFCSVLQVDTETPGPRTISLITNEKWKCMTLLVSVYIDTSTIDGSLTVSELYNLSNNPVDTQYGQLYGPMCVFGSDDILRFDLAPRAYNKKEIVHKNSLIDPANTLDNTKRHDAFRREEYETLVTIEYDYAAPNDIELFKVPYYPNSDYIIEGYFYNNNAKLSLCVPKERIRGVYDPTLMRTRTYIDGSYADSFFATVCDSTTGPVRTQFIFDSKDSITCGGSLRLYGQNSEPENVAGVLTKISSPRVFAIGEDFVYADTINSCVAQKVIEDLSFGAYTDTFVGLSGAVSQSNIFIQYSTPNTLRPNSYKNAFVDFAGKLSFTESKNDLNIFRVDGDFEPSYKDVLYFSSTEDKLLSKIFYRTFNGANTNVTGTNDIGLWYRRVSDSIVAEGTTAINESRVQLPFAIGRIFISPNMDIWKSGMYTKAKDKTIDDNVIGIDARSTGRFFLGSRECNLPKYMRTHQFTCAENDSKFSVSYIMVGDSLSIQIDVKKIISDELFSKGVAQFFDNVRTALSSSNPYTVAREYIDSELINAYSLRSVEIYVSPSQVTEVASSSVDPSILTDYVKLDELQVNDQETFAASFPLDGSRRVLLAFNITRN